MNGVGIHHPDQMVHGNMPRPPAEQYVRMTVTGYKQLEQHLNNLTSRIQAYSNLQTELQQRDLQLAHFKKLANDYKSKYEQLLHLQQHGMHPAQHFAAQPSPCNNYVQMNVAGERQAQGTPPLSQQVHSPPQHQEVQRGNSPGHQVIPQQTMYPQPTEQEEEMGSTSLGLDFSLSSTGGVYPGMEDLLETLAEPRATQQADPVFLRPVSHWNNDYGSIAVDGEVSLENLKKMSSASTGKAKATQPEKMMGKTFDEPSFPKHIFKQVLQNNLRMHRSLTDLLSKSHTRLSQPEYEAVIAQLTSRVSEAEGKYKSLKRSLDDCQHEPEKLEAKIADYETQIAELRNVLTLKQSLLKFYTNEDLNPVASIEEQDQVKPEGVEAGSQTALDVDDLALSLANTSLEEELSCKTSQARQLKEAIEKDQCELKGLEEKKAQLEKEVCNKEATLSSLKRGMETQARKLQDTVKAIDVQERQSQKLKDTYKDYELKLAKIKREIEEKGSSTGDIGDLMSLYMTQIKQYEDDYKNVSVYLSKEQQRAKKLAEENEKLKMLLNQREQGVTARRPADLLMDRSSPRCMDYEAPWTQQQQMYRHQIVQDGPNSLRSPSRHSPAGTPDKHLASPSSTSSSPSRNLHTDFTPQEWSRTQPPQECPRCFRMFLEREEYGRHIKKCTD